ncbi:hypothetical protein G4B88_009376 [Cannabis sativa]|uniref:Uncharacterized protein n=1 Tax=Cannabis sativa TaxID=3483 RepID=A0A7J6E664_CANSA|nr:hypothetical protein G4B88_009376 [Cannabis sativa]
MGVSNSIVLRSIKEGVGRVRCVDINVRLNKITVLGYFHNNPKHILKALHKTGRRAYLWPPPPPPPIPTPIPKPFSGFRSFLPTCHLGFSD